MPTITIIDVPPYDGEYQLNFADLTLRDWSLIKRISGVRQAEFDDAVRNVDPDLVIAFAVICLQTTGEHRFIDEDKLYDARGGKIVVDYTIEDAAEGDADPPPQTPVGETAPARSDTTASSGTSTTPAETSASDQTATGSPDSATSATSPST